MLSGEEADRPRSKAGPGTVQSRAKALAALFRRHHPVKTPECVAAEAGCSRSAAHKWMLGQHLPEGRFVQALARRYGPEVLTILYGAEGCAS